MPEVVEIEALPAELRGLLVEVALARRIVDEEWDLFRIAADCCDDHGRHDWADCLRWAAAGKKRPLSSGFWYNDGAAKGNQIDVWSDLPGPLWEALEGGRVQTEDWSRHYGDRVSAWLALLGAWPLALASGWVPEVEGPDDDGQ